MRKILTIDPAITNAAVAVFTEDGTLHHSETISFDRKLSQEVRMWQIFDKLSSVVDKYPVDVIVSERQFVQIMSEMVGVIKAFAGSINVNSVLFMPPSKWKKLATGKGNVPEDELANLVTSIWPDLVGASEHEIDCAGLFMAWQKYQPPVKKPRVSKKSK